MKFLLLLLIPIFAFGYVPSNDRKIDADEISVLNSTYVTLKNDVDMDTNNIFGITNLTVTGLTTLDVFLNGPLKATAGVVSSGAINLTSEVTGILPVANGGTNSSTALTNDKVMVSTTGAVIESATTTTQLSYLDATSSIQTQLNGKQDTITILPIANGGTGSATQNFVDLTTNQSIAGVKTYTGQYVAVSTTNGMRPCNVMTELQRDAIAAPSEGDCIINSDTSELNFYLAAAWGQVGGGTGGSGEFNYLVGDDFDFEETIGGWTGDTGIAVSRNLTNGFLLRGLGFMQVIKNTGNNSGQTAKSPVFSIDAGDLGKDIVIKFDYIVNSGDVSAGDIIIEVIQDPLGTPVILKVENENILGGGGTHNSSFRADETIKDYQVTFKQVSASVPPTNIGYDNIKFKPLSEESEYLAGYFNPITNWEASAIGSVTGTSGGTLAIGTGGGAEYTVDQRQVGSDIEIRYKLRVGTSGASDVVGSYLFPFPVGILPQPSASGSYVDIGGGTITVWATAESHARVRAKIFSTGFILTKTDGSTATTAFGGDGSIFTNANITSFTVRFPVVGWNGGINSVSRKRTLLKVRAEGNALEVITANVTPIPFIETHDNKSAYDGTTFTAPYAGDFDYGGVFITSSNLTRLPEIWLDIGAGYFRYRGCENRSTVEDISRFNCIISMNMGDKAQLRTNLNGGTLVNFPIYHYLNINEVPSDLVVTGTFGDCQTKILSGNVGGPSDITSLEFTGLTIGNRYRVRAQIDSDQNALVRFIHGVSTPAQLQIAAGGRTVTAMHTPVFTATATNFRTRKDDAITTYGNNTQAQTWVELCESNKGETTKW